ncbi:hypothetical protein WJX75_008545 [Coccomyxa subellipsoidea]|uniref:Glycosyl transferase family 25 domain-containing protein n=1 Tax=Coccomyxa subellipsoidea TaxID=248742 RepID=A0ABR2YHU2_9CHLO
MFSAHPRHIASLHIRVKAHNASDVQLSVFLISLPQSSDRRERIRPQLLRHAASITEVQAIDGRKGDLQQFTIKVPPSCDATTKAQLAVTASHLKAIHEAYRSNADMALIVEDDMKVLRWPSHGLLYTAPPDWDILLLYMMGAQADSIYRSPSSLWVAWGPSIFSAGAYIIHRPAMQKILDSYMPGEDLCMHRFHHCGRFW